VQIEAHRSPPSQRAPQPERGLHRGGEETDPAATDSTRALPGEAYRRRRGGEAG
jgi:hypothetical protein